MTATEYETVVRTYLNEATAKFYAQAEIWRWLDQAASDIAKRSLCVRRILTSATGGNGVRKVDVDAYKVMEVEYVGTRPKVLTKIDPLKVGHFPLNGTAPQYWYEFGGNVYIDPLPDAVYPLRLYVADIPKLKTETVWADWTAGSGWSVGSTVVHAGVASNITYPITAGNYTFELKVTGIDGSLKLTAGTYECTEITTNGWHTQTAVANGTTLTMTGTSDVTVDSFTLYKEAAISGVTDEIELGEEWEQLVCLFATYCGLKKDRREGEAGLLLNMYANEFDYLRRMIVDVVPDGRADMEFK